MTALSSTHISDAVSGIKESNVFSLRQALADKLNHDLTEIENESESALY